MAKRQTRRSISVSRSTYERLRAYCETNGISMSQFVEHRVGDYLGRSILQPAAAAARPAMPLTERRDGPATSTPVVPVKTESENQPAAPAPAPVVMQAAAAAPVRTTITPRPAPPAPPPAKLKPEQIFTF
jgi:hypothetical protein